VAHLIKADVNFAANWSEALHIVTAAAAIASFLEAQQRTGWQEPTSSSQRRGRWCLCYLCVGRGSPTLQLRPRGGRSLLRSQLMKPMVAL
jgi:hypothetical protein